MSEQRKQLSMEEGASGLGRIGKVFRARRSHGREQHTFRLASSIRLTWGLGLASFLILSAAIGFLVGRVSEGEFQVPKALEDYQAQITQNAAQSVRRSVNEGVDDVVQLAASLGGADVGRTTSLIRAAETGDAADGAARRLIATLGGVREIHGRYPVLLVLSPEKVVAAAVGDDADLAAARLQPGPPFNQPDVQESADVGEEPMILTYAPLPLTDGGIATVVGTYDRAFLGFALEGAVPGDAWIVDRSGLVIGSLEPTGYVRLPRKPLVDAAARAQAGEAGAFGTSGSIDHQEIIGYAPVAGPGPAGSLGWSVVTTRSVASLSFPQTEARSQGLLSGLILAFVSVLIFGWLYVIIVQPVVRLQREAERLAYGDLSRAIEIIRYDEIGLTARALERIRVILIRKEARAKRRPTDPPAG